MEIVCPECQKDNTIVVDGGTTCQHCEKPLDDYKFLKPLIPAFLLIAMGVGASHGYEYFTEQERFPIIIEHSIVENCANLYSAPIENLIFKKKTEVCACALGKTQEEYSYSDFKDEQNVFMRAFRKNALECVYK